MSRLSLKQETIEAFASDVTQKAAVLQRRLTQKKNDIINSVPLLKAMKDKVTDFDQKMTDKYGKNYTKTRNILTGVGKFYIAGQIGGPAIVALGAINTAKALKPMLKAAEEKRQKGEVSGLIDFIKKNPKESARTFVSASLSSAVIACGLAGAMHGKLAARIGVAALVVAPEMKTLTATTKQWVRGEATFKDVARDAATIGISMGAFISGTNWNYDGSDHADMGPGSPSIAPDTHISVPVAKADKMPNPLRPQTPKMQTTLLNQEPKNPAIQTIVQKKAAEKTQ